ncbi:hypothetical protein EDB19DRAFT_1770670 [Suillus lakei]|nr:hypothetical protein EDB19DRAFT_1770670 [Suillus lakei]
MGVNGTGNLVMMLSCVICGSITVQSPLGSYHHTSLDPTESDDGGGEKRQRECETLVPHCTIKLKAGTTSAVTIITANAATDVTRVKLKYGKVQVKARRCALVPNKRPASPMSFLYEQYNISI